MLNEKVVIIRLVTVECGVLTGSSYKVHKVHRLFYFHMLKLMSQSLGSYNTEIVREIYSF